MAGKRSLDGNNAAFDMKSLGKHIEAVSQWLHSKIKRYQLIFYNSDSFRARVSADNARGHGNIAHPITDSFVFCNCPAKYTRPYTQGYHALPC